MRTVEPVVLISGGAAALLVPLIDTAAYRREWRGRDRELDEAISDLVRAAAEWTTRCNLSSAIGTEAAPISEPTAESVSCQRMWTTAQLAERFDVTSRCVLKWRPAGVGLRIGRCWAFSDADVAAIVAARDRP